MSSTQSKKSRKKDTKKNAPTIKTSNRTSPTDYSSSSFNLDKNSKGWLDSNISSQEKRPMMRASPQDIMGAVSDEDILKLTKLTAEVEIRQLKGHHSRSRMDKDHEDSTRYRHQSQMQSTDKPDLNFSKNEGEQYDLVAQESSVMRNVEQGSEARMHSISPSKQQLEDENVVLDPKRFRQQTFAPKPKKQQNGESPPKAPEDKTEELNRNRSNRLTRKDADITRNKTISYHQGISDKQLGKRRHSFDSIHSLIKQYTSTHHSKGYRITHHDLESKEHLNNENRDSSANKLFKEEPDEIFAFDYDSIPGEIKELIDLYNEEGKLDIKNLLIKNEEDDNGDDEDDDDESENQTVNFVDIIKGPAISNSDLINQKRNIAMVKVSADDRREVITVNNINDLKMDLHISMMGDKLTISDYKAKLQDLSKTVDIQIESLEHLKNRSKLFLDDHREIIMNIESEKMHSRGFQYSKYNLQSLDKSAEPIDSLIDRMREQMKGFQNCLDDTEKTVHSVQNDMDDTRNRMGTYIKDIPQDFYSELKTLEVEIDIILAKRAKNPWIDIGYALLSYLLAIIAIIVWVLIYILKRGKKVLLFPSKLWHTYRDYVSERNKLVRVASQMSISGRRNSASIDRRPSQPIIFSSATDMYESSI